jgi:uncharacterized protein YbjT (DUF2867 family)
MKMLVLGGTGTVGSHVVRELSGRGAEVTVLTRDPAKARDLPKGTRVIQGSLLSIATIRSAFDGMDGVFLLNAVSESESHQGLLALNGARAAGVKKIVYLSIFRLDDATHLPHFGSKIGIEAAIKALGLAWTILRPSHFFQNDYWLKDALLGYGVYPQPLGDVGCSRVDVRDIGEAAAIALTTSGAEGQTIPVVGPTDYTGKSAAEVWSRALGKPIQYGGNDLETWEKQFAQMVPDWLAYDIRLMFEQFGRHGLRSKPADLEKISGVLGHAPRAFEAFAAETAGAWKG